jgi:hypothetical protein
MESGEGQELMGRLIRIPKNMEVQEEKRKMKKTSKRLCYFLLGTYSHSETPISIAFGTCRAQRPLREDTLLTFIFN